MPDTQQVKEFYDEFSARLLRDYIHGNRRVDLIHRFLREAVPPSTGHVLEIGCGTGALADFLSRQVAPAAHIDAFDLSSSNIEIAQALFASPRINFFQDDVLSTDKLTPPYDLIIIPDVYEHLPRETRAHFNAKVKTLLGPEGKIVLTCPTPGYFDWMKRNGHALQVIDEDITMDDLLNLARDADAPITFLRMVNVGLSNEFMHVLFERGGHQSQRVQPVSQTLVKMPARHNLLTRGWNRLGALWRLAKVTPKLRDLKARGIVPQRLWIPVRFKPEAKTPGK